MEPKDKEIIIKVNTKDIDFVNKIIEAYENVALVSTLDAKEGIISIKTSEDLSDIVGYILKTLPRDFEIVNNS